MRISDWSSDVCSSDLAVVLLRQRIQAILQGVCPAYDRVARIEDEAPGSVQARQDGLRHGATDLTAMEGAAVPIEALLRVDQIRWIGQCDRSEEHTSELQSLMRNSYAVFCLKKKKKTINQCAQMV